MIALRFSGLALLFAVALHGWGSACRGLLRMRRGGWPETTVIGLAWLVFLGGLLNVAGLAVPWALIGLVAVGAALSVPPMMRWFAGLQRFRVPWGALALSVPIAGVLWFTMATQLQPQSYNRYDDFQKYFAYPVRMLETGTLLGSPLSGLGSQTLGGEAFLHGFVLEALPFSYLNGLDAVFGLFLCMVLATRFGEGRRDQMVAALVCLLAVVFINPQYVNIAALYLGSALIMTVILLSSNPRELGESLADPAPNPAAMGLLHAALLAIKPTFLLYSALYLPAAVAAIALSTGNVRHALRWGIAVALCSAFFLSPWVVLHAPHYLAGLRAAPASVAEPKSGFATETLDLLSTHRLPYGGSMALYTGLVAAVIVGGLLAAWAGARSGDARVRLSGAMALAGGATAGAAYWILLPVVGPTLFGYAASVRYFTPFAIGLAPSVFGLSAFHMARSERSMHGMVRFGLPLALAAVSAAAFWPSLVERGTQAMESGSVLAFSALATSPGYINYNQKVLSQAERDYVAALQGQVPAGKALIAWVNAPFYLDFRRNPIVDVDPAGLSTPWAVIPEAHYVVWEYNGIATSPPSDYNRQAEGVGKDNRMIAVRTLAFGRRLEEAVRAGGVLYNDGQTVILHLPGPLPR